MTKTQMATWMVQQADKTDWSICCLCSKFNKDGECKYFEQTEYSQICVDGIAEALRNVEKEKYGGVK